MTENGQSDSSKLEEENKKEGDYEVLNREGLLHVFTFLLNKKTKLWTVVLQEHIRL